MTWSLIVRWFFRCHLTCQRKHCRLTCLSRRRPHRDLASVARAVPAVRP